jgi:hypothetical protein
MLRESERNNGGWIEKNLGVDSDDGKIESPQKLSDLGSAFSGGSKPVSCLAESFP